jgi:hypothetical protein
MINKKILVVEFLCDCCGKYERKDYDLLENAKNSKIYPEKWAYIDNGSYQDALVCDECWDIYNKVKNLIK